MVAAYPRSMSKSNGFYLSNSMSTLIEFPICVDLNSPISTSSSFTIQLGYHNTSLPPSATQCLRLYCIRTSQVKESRAKSPINEHSYSWQCFTRLLTKEGTDFYVPFLASFPRQDAKCPGLPHPKQHMVLCDL